MIGTRDSCFLLIGDGSCLTVLERREEEMRKIGISWHLVGN
jgi:hypothetical protein